MMSNTKKQEGCTALQNFNRVVTVMLTAILLGLSFPEVRVSASSNTGYTEVPANTFTVKFYTDSAIDQNIDTNDDVAVVFVPLYVTFSSSELTNRAYLNGYLTFSSSILSNFGVTIDGAAANYLRFEPNYLDGIYLSRPDYSNPVLFFDDFYMVMNSNNSNYVRLLGYMVYSGECTDGIANVRMNPYNYTPTISSSTALYRSYYEIGLYQTIINAIDSSTSTEDIIDLLEALNATATANGSSLSTIITRLNTSNYTTDQILQLLNQYFAGGNSGATAASEAADDLGSQANVQASMEAVLASLSPGDFTDMDDADAFGVLRDTTVSLSFWGQLVSGFADYSGVIWGFFILALMLGLIAFILRLR